MKYLAVAISLLFASSAASQDIEKKYLFTKQECWPFLQFYNIVAEQWKEEPLLMGQSITLGARDGESFTGGMIFFVNQDSGTWTMASLYADGTVCIQGAGTEFSPYGG